MQKMETNEPNSKALRSGRAVSEPLHYEKHIKDGWERLVMCASQSQVQAAAYGGSLAGELQKLRAEGWTMTYSLRNDTGRTYYFKRALASVPRRLKETAMW